MYLTPRSFAGIVIADDDDAALTEQYMFSGDGIGDGAEGVGLLQAAMLKRKLGRNRRRFRVGRQPYAVVGGSRYDYGFGAISLNTPVGGVKISLKKSSESRAKKVIGGLVASANSGNMSAVAVIDLRRGSGISKERAVWVGGYNKISQSVLARYLPRRAQYIASIPPSANITGGTIEGGAAWALSNPQTVVDQSPTVTPSVGPAIPAQTPQDATGAPLPAPIYSMPAQSPVAPSSAPTASQQTAAAAQPTADESGDLPYQPLKTMDMGGMFGNFDPKLLIFGTIALLVVPKLLNGGGSRSRRRRR